MVSGEVPAAGPDMPGPGACRSRNQTQATPGGPSLRLSLIPNPFEHSHGSDVPLKEYIRSLDEAAPAGDKFIIAELDDNNLFVKVAKAPFVQTKVKEFINSLHYTKPEVPMAGQA